MEEFERIERIRRRIHRFVRELTEEMRREFEELERGFTSVFESIDSMEEMRKPMWSPSGVLEPLYRVEDLGDRYRILVDLPKANEATLEIRAYEHRIELKCKLKSAVKLESWLTRYRDVQFSEYRASIELPEPIDPKSVQVRWRRGFAEILVNKL